MLLLLCGCAASPTAPDASSLFADSLFKPVADPPRREDVFALSPAMRRFMDDRIAARTQESGARRGLYEAVRQELTLQYDSEQTLTAAQAFDARSGNCLSLVILTAAFARALDIPVRYQSVHGLDAWSRVNGIAFLSGHVNLVLGHGVTGRDLSGRPAEPDVMTIDFVAPGALARQHTREISEQTVIAMFMNNRAAELLAQGEAERAYWWAREALRSAPSFLPSYNTLGVIYRRHGNLPQAERALRRALQGEPDSAAALGNLAGVLSAQGRAAEAREVIARLERIEQHPPFYFLDLGLKALQRGEFAAAKSWFEKEQRRMPYDDEVHFALALASLNLGEVRHARRELTLALENSNTRDRRGIYAAKLEKLRELPLR